MIRYLIANLAALAFVACAAQTPQVGTTAAPAPPAVRYIDATNAKTIAKGATCNTATTAYETITAVPSKWERDSTYDQSVIEYRIFILCPYGDVRTFIYTPTRS